MSKLRHLFDNNKAWADGIRQQFADIGGDERACAAVSKLIHKLSLGIERTEMRNTRAYFARAEKGKRVIRSVGKIQRYRGAAAFADAHETRGKPVGLTPQPNGADQLIAKLDRNAGAVIYDGLIEQSRDGRWR